MYRDMAEDMLRELTVAREKMQVGYGESEAFIKELYSNLSQMESVWKHASGPAAIQDVYITMEEDELRITFGKRAIPHTKQVALGPLAWLGPSSSGCVTLRVSEGWTAPEERRQTTSQELPCDMKQTIAIILSFLKASELSHYREYLHC